MGRAQPCTFAQRKTRARAGGGGGGAGRQKAYSQLGFSFTQGFDFRVNNASNLVVSAHGCCPIAKPSNVATCLHTRYKVVDSIVKKWQHILMQMIFTFLAASKLKSDAEKYG